MKYTLIILFLGSSISCFCFQQDSINTSFSTRIKVIEDHKENAKDELNNRFNELSQKIKNENQIAKWFALIGVPISLMSILGLFISISEIINKRIQKEIHKTIIENKKAIKKAVEEQHEEILFVKTKRILVLTKEKENEQFLRNFFKTMKFQKDHIVFETGKSIVPNNQNSHVKHFDMVFANNEKTDLDFDIIHSYFKTSNSKSVLFYFGSERFTAQTPEIGNRLNMASFRTQIYGNLINLFKYQKLLK